MRSVKDQIRNLRIEESIGVPNGDKGDIVVTGSTWIVKPEVLGTGIPQLAVQDLSGHRVVVNIGNNLIDYADKDTLSPMTTTVMGVIENAVEQGKEVVVTVQSTITEPSWNWTAGMPIFLGNDGHLTQSVPTTGFSLQLGAAITPQTMWVNIQRPVELA